MTRTEIMDRAKGKPRRKIRDAQLVRKRLGNRAPYEGITANCRRCRVNVRFFSTEDMAVLAFGRTWGYELCVDRLNGLLHTRRTWSF
ncbi:MAG TPA: hypothetical protein VFZ62_03600 [Candidatus Saccharimonadales bacterium]